MRGLALPLRRPFGRIFPPEPPQDERGDAMIVWCLLLAVMLLPLGGLSIDLWHGIAAQRQLQAAAEDAAAAGASGIDTLTYRSTGCILLDPATAEALARANLAAQAGLSPLAAANIDVIPGGNEITVVLTEDVHLTLLSWVEGGRPLVVTATASSQARGSLRQESGCP
jgi:Flp pilus assembly protein TadG